MEPILLTEQIRKSSAAGQISLKHLTGYQVSFFAAALFSHSWLSFAEDLNIYEEKLYVHWLSFSIF